jgi:prohibitin 2
LIIIPLLPIRHHTVAQSRYNTAVKMNNRPNPMQDYINKIQEVARSRGGPGGGFPRGMPSGPRMGGALGGILLLGGGIWAVQNALFNVDGGHRAIKYRRTTGVSKEIYSEGFTRSATC